MMEKLPVLLGPKTINFWFLVLRMAPSTNGMWQKENVSMKRLSSNALSGAVFTVK
jgi:hypothetical protein